MADEGMQNYSPAFFDRRREGARQSAAALVPFLQTLVQPRSVVDVGCGTGTWVVLFLRHGVIDVAGVDGDWVDVDALEMPRQAFVSADLTGPVTLGRRFDLVISLEVAEHLPESSAACFVKSLVDLGPIVVFSAAIPLQGGIQHINEQWPEYWAALFADHGYTPVDCVRPFLWNDDRVEWWYAQNTIVYVNQTALDSNAVLRQAARATAANRLSMVHPRAYADALARCDSAYFRPDANRLCLSTLISVLPRVTMNALRNRLRLVSPW